MIQTRKSLLILLCAIALLGIQPARGTSVVKGQAPTSDLYLPNLITANAQERGDEIPVAEHRALESLYNNTQGQAWTLQTGWLQNDSPCTWQGIVCRAGHVVILDLPQNNLAGPLPAEIGDLSKLEEIYLYDNQLAGLPPAIDRMNGLRILDLSHNLLTALPAEIGNLPSLVDLDLEDNQIGSLPTEIGNLSSLQDLNLAGNELTALPPAVGNLQNLRGLYLWDNRLTALPVEIGSLNNLEALYAWSNQIATLPSELGSLTNLKWLHLSGNQLTALPLQITSLTLNQLEVAENCLGAVSDPTVVAWLDVSDTDWRQTQRSDCIP